MEDWKEDFGDYRLLARIGRGGMADVFLALPRAGAPEPVVIKRIRREIDTDAEIGKLFEAEASLARELEHERIVRTLTVGEVDGRHFLALELLEGASLDRLRERANEQAHDVSDLEQLAIVDALAGLHHAHELGIVHRDVGPHNVLLLGSGSAKVVDFGVAKAQRRATKTTGGVVKGKIRWMAPEQALSLPVDRRADVFSAGVMIWEAAARRAFWPEEIDDVTIGVRLAQGDYPLSPRDAGIDVPDAIDAICRRALARDAGERYTTAEELRSELTRHLDAGDDLAPLRTKARTTMEALFGPDLRKLSTLLERAQAPTPITDEIPAGRTNRLPFVAVAGLGLALVGAFALYPRDAERPVVPARAENTLTGPSASVASTDIPVPSVARAEAPSPSPSPSSSANIAPPPKILARAVDAGATPPHPSIAASGAPVPSASALGRIRVERDPDPWAGQ